MPRQKRQKKWDKRWILLLCLIPLAVGLLVFFHGKQPRKNPYRAEDFSYDENGYLQYKKGKALRGIDVSEHQGDIDFAAVRESGVEFVMIRVGYRGYKSGTLNKDERAEVNYQNAKAAGLQVGVYFFSQAVTVAEAEEEAEMLLQCIEDWELDLWAAYDWEYVNEQARTAGMDARLLTDCTKAFLSKIAQAGEKPMIYCNRSQARDLLYMEELSAYDLWLAMYQDPIDAFPYAMKLWQYTNTGSVPGISGNVDLNLYFIE